MGDRPDTTGNNDRIGSELVREDLGGMVSIDLQDLRRLVADDEAINPLLLFRASRESMPQGDLLHPWNLIQHDVALNQGIVYMTGHWENGRECGENTSKTQ